MVFLRCIFIRLLLGYYQAGKQEIRSIGKNEIRKWELEISKIIFHFLIPILIVNSKVKYNYIPFRSHGLMPDCLHLSPFDINKKGLNHFFCSI